MAQPPLIVVTGTGTEIGKTHTSSALLRCWSRTAKVRGLKPIETGVRGPEGADAAALRLAGSFPSSPPFGETFRAPVSPHLAARQEGRSLDVRSLAARIRHEALAVSGLLVELAGGLFSPLGPNVLNVDLALALSPSATLLVAPDRLGVLHDIGAATRAARSSGLSLSAVVLVAPEVSDQSTGHNAREVSCVTDIPVVATLGRATVEALSVSPEIEQLLVFLTNR